VIRLNFVVEGQTEETFVRDVLAPHLAVHHVVCTVRRVETGRRKLGPRHERVFRGGLLEYERAKRDLLAWMRQDTNDDARFTTMFDLYALPDTFPKFADAKLKVDPYERVAVLEGALACDVEPYRFIPYVQLHEFEALLFADASGFATQFPGEDDGVAALVQVANEFANPELINDGAETAPSKRVEGALPAYRKPVAGPLIAAAIGLPGIRDACPHFDEWLATLERLAQPSRSWEGRP
jgi:hypothetical protein